MKICFVTKERLSEFWERTGGEDADLIFFPLFDDVTVSYERELKGETAYFEDVALLSKACGCTVVCGYNTSTRGIVRSSAVVAENGRILGVSDALSSIDGTRNCGAFLKVYETGAGRIGVAVAEDAYFPEVLRTLAACGSDFVLCPFSRRAAGVCHTDLDGSGARAGGVPAAGDGGVWRGGVHLRNARLPVLVRVRVRRGRRRRNRVRLAHARIVLRYGKERRISPDRMAPARLFQTRPRKILAPPAACRPAYLAPHAARAAPNAACRADKNLMRFPTQTSPYLSP